MKKKYLLVFFIILLAFTFSLKYILSPFTPLLWVKVDNAFTQGNHNLAKKHLRAITWIQPKNSEAYILKAWLEWSEALLRKKDGSPYEEKLTTALMTLRRGQKYNPKNWQLYFEEGMMWEAFGEEDKSLDAYYQVSIVGPLPYSRMYSSKKKMLASKGIKKYEIATPVYDLQRQAKLPQAGSHAKKHGAQAMTAPSSLPSPTRGEGDKGEWIPVSTGMTDTSNDGWKK